MPFLFFIICPFVFNAQIANYVSNGGFELLNSGASAYGADVTKFWGPIDTTKYSNYLCTVTPSIQNAPYVSTGFQYPRNGNTFIGCQFYCGSNVCNSTNSRQYPRNRLKQNLQAGKKYCSKYYIVNTNNNVVAIDGYGMYFADSSIDTIHYCNMVITYLNPQVQYTGGIITDTLNWVPITGTFVATGTEKYLVLGNFKSNAATNTLQTNPPSFAMTADIYIDDVSVIDIDLPAFAGPDIWGIPTNTVYLGRPQDVGIDEACMWYKLPNTTTAIDTAAGITVTVASTTNTYMVRQDICGNIKYDTVVVSPSGVGIHELKLYDNQLNIYPQPANEILNLEITELTESLTSKIKIINCLGQLIKDEEINFKNKTAQIKIDQLPNGVYVMLLDFTQSDKSLNVSKRFVIAR